MVEVVGYGFVAGGRGVRVGDGEVVGVFGVFERSVVEWLVDVVEEDVPETRPEDRALEHHVGEVEGRGGLAVDKDDGLASREVVVEEGKESVGETGLAEFVEEKWSVDVVESTFDVRQENPDFAGTSEFVDPSVDEKGDEVVGAVVFTESPLSVSERIVGVEEGEEGDCEEAFGYFGEDGCEVDAAVIVGVVGGAFLVEGSKPVEFPESGPFGCGENFACKEIDGKGE